MTASPTAGHETCVGASRIRLVVIFACALLAACGGESIASQDASIDDASQDAPPHDAQTDASPIKDVAQPDGGYFITIEGDGVSQTLQSDRGLPGVTVPASLYVPSCERLFVIVGAESPDGGAMLYFQIDSDESPPPAPTQAATLVYERSDGTYFSSLPTNGQPIFSELDGPGGAVAGSYAVTVTSADAGSLSLSGTFYTLRLPDEQPTPCPP